MSLKSNGLGVLRKVVVTEAEGGPLVGMALLQNTRFTLDVIEGGQVTIESLDPQP